MLVFASSFSYFCIFCLFLPICLVLFYMYTCIFLCLRSASVSCNEFRCDVQYTWHVFKAKPRAYHFSLTPAHATAQFSSLVICVKHTFFTLLKICRLSYNQRTKHNASLLTFLLSFGPVTRFNSERFTKLSFMYTFSKIQFTLRS